MGLYIPPRIIAAPAMKAGPVGSGAGVMMTEYPLSSILGGRSPQDKMRKAYQIGWSVPWIRAAERTIAGAFSTVGWHLEDEEDVEIDDDYSNKDAQAARLLIAKPQANVPVGAKLSRSDLWRLTCRHVGLTGNSFWFLDGLNVYGIPTGVLYLRPDRLTPDEDSNGNLQGWWIDRTPNDPGTHVRLDQILHFMFEPPDEGHFGVGLIESALMKAQISNALDKHLMQVLDSGGRLAGIMAPKANDHLEEPQYQQLVSDARSIVEQPDAAKRLHVLRGPVDFTPTTMNLLEMAVRDFMTGARDDLLGLWGVPVSMLGIHDRGRALGASAVIEHDDATLWTMAVHPRLGAADQGGFVEVIQGQLLDRWTEIGVAVELEIDEPSFDDDAPKYVQAQQAEGVPLTSAERREILGKEPFGPEKVNPETGIPYDDEVWLPSSMVRAFIASEEAPKAPPPPEPVVVQAPMDAAALVAGETSAEPATKALVDYATSIRSLRSSVEEQHLPRLTSSIQRVLQEQQREVVARVLTHYDQIKRKPRDTSVYFPDLAAQDRKLGDAIRPATASIANTVNDNISSMLPVIESKAHINPISELAASVAALAARENPPPIVNVTTPEVHVEPAQVTIAEGAIQATFEAKASTSKRVIRDEQGRIAGLEE